MTDAVLVLRQFVWSERRACRRAIFVLNHVATISFLLSHSLVVCNSIRLYSVITTYFKYCFNAA